MKLISIEAQSHSNAVRSNCPSRRMSAVCFVALCGTLPFGQATAAKFGGGTIPPNLAAALSKPASAQPKAAVKAPAPKVTAKPVAKPANPSPLRVTTGGVRHGLSSIPPNPSSQTVRAPAPAPAPAVAAPAPAPAPKPSIAASAPAPTPIPAAAAPAPQADSSPARAGEVAKERPAPPSAVAERPAPSTAASASSAPAPAAAVASKAPAIDKPVRTEYINGSDGHQITITYVQRPDGTIYKTAVSPAAFPPPNASAARTAPSPAQPTQRASTAPVPSDTKSTASVSQSNTGASGTRNTAASEPIKLAYAPSASATDRSPAPADGLRHDRGVIPPDTSSPVRTGEAGSFTVMVPDTSAAEQDRGGELRARPPRQGMDVVDRRIGEFDATPAAPGTVQEASTADTALRYSPGQARAAASMSVAQPAGDEQATPRSRRSRLASASSAKRSAVAARAKPVQPLLFGRVTRASFALARLEAAATVTRGVRLAANPTPAVPAGRPGVVSGRGIAQTADLGRGSPTYGAATDVFASAGELSEPPPAVACKPKKKSSRHAALRHQGRSRAAATACS